ncbi:MAG: regulatory iron-sulfur-containing complex subunit RicT [Oscillibacter sp.]
MAKTQNLSLNPTKISGTCGRLMCCLKYEQNVYEDAAKRMPKAESLCSDAGRPGNVEERGPAAGDREGQPGQCAGAFEVLSQL